MSNAAEVLSPGEQLLIRRATADDLPLFFSATLNSYLYGSPMNRHVPPEIFFGEHHKVLERILARPGSDLVVAALADDPIVILGFALVEGPVLHYAYVKKPFRRLGIASRLLAFSGIDIAIGADFSHWTYDFLHVKNAYPKLRYNPYLQERL